MRIDEKQEKFDLSDHDVMEIVLKIKEERKECRENEWITKEYYKTDRKALENFWKKAVQKSGYQR